MGFIVNPKGAQMDLIEHATLATLLKEWRRDSAPYADDVADATIPLYDLIEDLEDELDDLIALEVTAALDAIAETEF